MAWLETTAIVLRSTRATISLNVGDNNMGTDNGDLVISFNGQSITAVDHFDPNDESIEFINFDNGSFGGYQFGTGDYAISAADPAGTPRVVAVTTGNNLLAGEAGDNAMTGGTGNDLLFGAAGNDTLNGGAGSDLLVGGTGRDILNGGDDADTLIGGQGADTMNGGLGNDHFVFDDGHSGTGVTNRDVIVGFATGDTIDFAAIDANLTMGGGGTNGQSFTFIGNAIFSDATPGTTLSTGQIRYQFIDTNADGANDATLIQGNVDNNLGADFEIVLENHTTPLTANDFLL
jgi:Ca2+-binding RTX toxin-like protein